MSKMNHSSVSAFCRPRKGYLLSSFAGWWQTRNWGNRKTHRENWFILLPMSLPSLPSEYCHQRVKKQSSIVLSIPQKTTKEKLKHFLPKNHWTWSLNSGRVHLKNMSLGKQGNKWWQADSNFRGVWFLALLVSKNRNDKISNPREYVMSWGKL